MAKSNGPTWFKMHSRYRDVIMALPDAAVSNGLKLAMNYFVDGILPDDNIDNYTKIVFDMLCFSIADAKKEYQAKVEGGKRGASIKYHKKQDDDNYIEVSDDGLPW